MRLSLFIAKRYLFSKKKQNAINIISIISIVGIVIGSAALIIVLSVFNGIDLLLQKSTDSFTPDIVISPAQGKFMNVDTSLNQWLENRAGIIYHQAIVEEKALLKYNDKIAPVIVKGVTPDYVGNTYFEDNLIQGSFILKSGDSHRSVIGSGVAFELGIGLNFLTPMIFYYPNRETTTTAQALNTGYSFPSAFFSSQQTIDGKYVITDIAFAQKLFMIDQKISMIEIKLINPDLIPIIKQELRSKLNNTYKVEDKMELNKSFYAMMKSEKLAVFLILLFILFIASFNIVGSISMLILDKKEDLFIYRALGMRQKDLISVFKTEGNLITSLGALIGLIIGLTFCLLQEKYGFITLGDGNYIMPAYPVKLVAGDILTIMATVLFIGYAASYFPVKYLIRKLVPD